MLKLVLIFILVPLIELALLIELGRFGGTLPTIALIVTTGFLGAVLARHQGLGVLREMRAEVAGGRLPARPIVDGVIILLAGAMLLTPGILTDLFGFLCLIPASRKLIRGFLWRRTKRAVREGRVQVFIHVDTRKRPQPESDQDPASKDEAGRAHLFDDLDSG